jgi:hypothetical protein
MTEQNCIGERKRDNIFIFENKMDILVFLIIIPWIKICLVVE